MSETESQPPQPLAAGASAPDFTWEENGETVRLSERKERCLLFFYPLAYSPVCREDLHQLHLAATELGGPEVKRLAISVDDAALGGQFLEELGVEALVAVPDPDLHIAAAYGVKRREGVAERATFLVGSGGTIEASAVHDLCFPRPLESIRQMLL